jgi:hypothetical protein
MAEPKPPRPCLYCRNDFTPVRSHARFCSRSCADRQKRRETAKGTACAVCGAPLYTGVRYCSRRCGMVGARGLKPRPCAGCEQPFTPRRDRQRFCSKPCWWDSTIGDERISDDGYVLVRVPRDTPGAHSNGWMLKHRYVMQEHLGRSLSPDEDVHHRNGDRTDNVETNLELWSTSQPRGQRVEDKLAWCREFLARYDGVPVG